MQYLWFSALGAIGRFARATMIAIVFGGWLVHPADVQAQTDPSPNCLDRMILVGEAAAVAETQRLLARGLLAKLPAEACDGVWLRISRTEDNRWSFILRNQNQAVEHTVKDFETMASWVESWLLSGTYDPPVADQPPVAPPDHSSAVVTSPVTASAKTEPTQSAPKPPASELNAIPIQLALRGVTDFDSVGPVWFGASLALRIDISRHAWFGMAASGTWAPEHDATKRRALRMSARVGWLQPLGWGAFMLGGGAGIVAGEASRETADTVVRDEESGPIIEALTGLDVFLSSQWSVSFAAVGRAYLSDEFFSGGEPPAPGEPTPLSTWSLSLEVGIAWDFARPS